MHSEFEPSSAFKQPDLGTAPGSDLSSSLSSRFEMSGADISSAHQYFQPGDLGAHFGTAPSFDAGALTAPITGAEVPAIATPLAGGDSVLAGALAGVNEPISPIIQIIMRMPGAMGLMNSFFEMLANFFMNPMGMFDMLNPAFLGHQVAGAFSGLTSHSLPLSFSLLPAPLVGNMSGLANPMFSSDLLSTKLNLSLAHSTSNLGSPSSLNFDGSGTLNASGIDPGKPLYEGAPASAVSDPHGGILAGPGMSDTAAGSHIAGNTRLFSDQLAGGGGSGFNGMNLATKTPTTLPTGLASNNLSSTTTGFGMAPQSLQMGSPLARAGSMPAVGGLSDSVMPTTMNASNNALNPLAGSDSLFAAPEAAKFDTSAFSPSLGSGSELGGGNQLIAMDNGSGMSDIGTKVAMDQPFRPTLGGNGQSVLERGMTAEPQGLKATQYTLDSPSASDTYSAITKPATVPNTTPLAQKTASTAGLQQNAAPGSAHGNNAHSALGDKSHSAAATQKPVEAHKSLAGSGKHAPSSDRGHFIKTTPARNSHSAELQADPARGASDAGAETTDAAATDAATDAPSETVSYTIERGDCLWNIAKEHLGDGFKWQEIYELNSNVLGTNPDLIYPGTTIQLPGGGTEIASSTAGAETYIVKPGDNLWDISREHLGSGTHWGDLYKANQDVIGANPRLIHPGQELTLPGTGDPTNVAQVDPTGAQADPTAQAQGVEVDPTMESGSTTGGDALSSDAPGGDLHSDASSMNQGTLQNSFSDYARQQPASLPTSSLPQSQSMPLGHSAPTSWPQANPIAHQPAASSASHISHAVNHATGAGQAAAHAAPAAHHAAAAAHTPAAHSAQVAANHAPAGPSHHAAASQAPMLQQDPQNVFSPSISQVPSGPTVPHSASAMSNKGLPVIPANSQPIASGPDAAHAATPHPNNAVVSSSLFSDLQNFLKNRK